MAVRLRVLLFSNPGFPDRRRGLYYPYSSIVYGVGCTLGAALGGFLAEHLGWRWIFASQIPVMLVCLAVSAVAIPRDLGLQRDGNGNTATGLRDSLRDFDFVGSGLLCVILTTMILGLVSPRCSIHCQTGKPLLFVFANFGHGFNHQNLGGQILPCKSTWPSLRTSKCLQIQILTDGFFFLL